MSVPETRAVTLSGRAVEPTDLRADAEPNAIGSGDSTIGAIYTLIRDINHKVADLATDLLEQKKPKGK